MFSFAFLWFLIIFSSFAFLVYLFFPFCFSSSFSSLFPLLIIFSGESQHSHAGVLCPYYIPRVIHLRSSICLFISYVFFHNKAPCILSDLPSSPLATDVLKRLIEKQLCGGEEKSRASCYFYWYVFKWLNLFLRITLILIKTLTFITLVPEVIIVRKPNKELSRVSGQQILLYLTTGIS